MPSTAAVERKYNNSTLLDLLISNVEMVRELYAKRGLSNYFIPISLNTLKSLQIENCYPIASLQERIDSTKIHIQLSGSAVGPVVIPQLIK